MLKYHLITYGCQMNQSDSERIDSLLQSNKFKPTVVDTADFLILNLCSVRQSAIDRVWGRINQIKKTNPQTKIILTGCILPDDKKKLSKKSDLILNITELPTWPKKIKKLGQRKTTGQTKTAALNYKSAKDTYSDYFKIIPKHQSAITAYVPIMTGCNNFCSYCAVPYTRGREQSRPAEDIIKEVYTLIIRGYKQIILLGQNVNSYQGILNSLKIKNLDFFKNSKFKIKNSKHINFPALLKLIDSIPGNYWLNFTSSHPKDLSPNLINCFKSCQHLTPYMHFALQSGSDKIIKRMNRHYTAQKYINLTKKLRQACPGIAITTDIIVGFPGESKVDFAKTAQLMKQVKFDMVYTAKYSPRPNTAAAKLKDNISPQEKKEREKKLTEILKKTALANNKKIIGQTIDVLVENRKKNYLAAKTSQFKHVKIKSNKTNVLNKFIKVKITKASPWGLEGKIVDTLARSLADKKSRSINN